MHLNYRVLLYNSKFCTPSIFDRLKTTTVCITSLEITAGWSPVKMSKSILARTYTAFLAGQIIQLKCVITSRVFDLLLTWGKANVFCRVGEKPSC